MDAQRFDQLASTLDSFRSRRGMVQVVLATPIAAALAAWLDDDGDAAKRKRRHAQRHRTHDRHDKHHANRHQVHESKKKKKKKKKPCAQTGQAPQKGQACCSGLTLDGSGVCTSAPTPPSPPPPPPPPPPLACAASCSGCCTGETCSTGETDGACGAGGDTCAPCSGLHGTCFQQACVCDVCAGGDCPFDSIADAIADAGTHNGDTITVCPGTYNALLTVNKSVTIAGAGSGSSAANNTIIDGTGLASGFAVITIEQGKTVTLSNLRIRGGADLFKAGGIWNRGKLTLANAIVTENTAENGGGIYNDMGSSGAVTLTLGAGTQITGNSATGSGRGGGIYNAQAGTVTMQSGSSVSGNSAVRGGGIHNSGAQSVLTLQSGSNLDNNWATEFGGGIYNGQQCNVTLKSGSHVGGNGKDDSNAIKTTRGGGIYNSFGSTLTVESGSTLQNNAALDLGGGIFNTTFAGFIGSVTLADGSHVTGNSAGTAPSGGGVYNDGATLTVDSTSIIATNSPDQCISTTAVTNCNPT